MSDKLAAIFREHPLFAGLSARQVAKLEKLAARRRLPADTPLFWENGYAGECYLLAEGLVEHFVQSGSRKVILQLIEPMSVFPLDSIFGEPKFTASARTLKTSEIFALPRAALLSIAKNDRNLTFNAAVELARAYEMKMAQIKDYALKLGIERVADFLLETHARQGGQGKIRLAAGLHVIAPILGLAPESLSRIFARLRRCGVEVKGRDITIRDVDQLRAIAAQAMLKRPNITFSTLK